MMNQTKFHLGDRVVHIHPSFNKGLPLLVDKIRSNARGENEYQLKHLSGGDPLINTEWFNENDLERSDEASIKRRREF